MNQTYLLIGGNLGNRSINLDHAKKMLEQNTGRILSISSVFETAPWGNSDQPAYFNQALSFETSLDPDHLLSNILEIENKMGRKREIKYGARTIDIDILFYGDLVQDRDQLTIPHPQLHLRKFALEPLNEIAPGFIHPLLKKSISELLHECPDPLTVKKL